MSVLCEQCDAKPICGLRSDSIEYATALADSWRRTVVISFECPAGRAEIERDPVFEVELDG